MADNKKPSDKKAAVAKVPTKEEKKLIQKQDADKKKKAFNKENILK